MLKPASPIAADLGDAPPIEIELKFQLPASAAAALFDHPALGPPEPTRALRAVYFDTPEGELRARGFILRRREQGGRVTQTLKHQDGAGALERCEWEIPSEGDGIDPEALRDTPVRALLEGRHAQMTPVFTTVIDRTVVMVRDDAALIEVCLDRGSIVAGERAVAVLELELELITGASEALFTLGRRLLRDLPLTLSCESKSARGFRLTEGALLAPRTAQPAELDPGMSAGEAFQRIARAALAQVTANGALLLQVRRPEALHQMRVGLRRLRTAMSTFKPILRDDQGQAVSARLKWLAGELDAARDLDVFLHGLFLDLAKAMPRDAAAALGQRLKRDKDLAYRRVLAAIDQQAYRELVFETAAWIEIGPWTRSGSDEPGAGRDGPVTDLALAALDRLDHAVRKHSRGFSRLDATQRHALRIRIKRLRYATEAFADLFDDPAAHGRARSGLKRLQTVLGDLNDLAQARLRLSAPDAAGHSPRIPPRLRRSLDQQQARLLRTAAAGVARYRREQAFWR